MTMLWEPDSEENKQVDKLAEEWVTPDEAPGSYPFKDLPASETRKVYALLRRMHSYYSVYETGMTEGEAQLQHVVEMIHDFLDQSVDVIVQAQGWNDTDVEEE
jgi:hypothetical protein